MPAVDTFVIRLWTPADPATAPGDTPRGVVEHVGTGRAAAFGDGAALLALLRELPRRGGGPSAGASDAPGAEPA